ncbi:NAD(P)-dependent dehydrogenase (short-subunit alcohol dehydrogenase family) [Tahibacter aquaticus]|uniref:NAD(P)-dependent dehydrogenase (Short-subunit alcohol dehydrogenase family) n=1 Tax=Tahibacter aquaticus TaxID=520092 RepID=A0A4R6Z937_9GAMM|nr:SDR family oxidoreductase [Tahibacter aquaticus]TDR48417.1 NAD(P)-dependent dehydrogenase (short-subunit alcohol dehydrogenase family) [Tahibacter aquaticus]
MAIYPSLQDRLILVTGGGGGIGAAIVAAFARQSAEVVFIDVDAAGAAQTVRAIVDGGAAAPRHAVCDLRDIPRTLQAVEALLQGRAPHALINNAGNDQAQPLEDVTLADWDDRVAVNLRHQFFLAQAVAPRMRAVRSGAIVNLGSIAWMMGAAGVPVYATLKSAVAGLTKSLARELGGDNIRVNAIAPGWVLTERQLEKGRADPAKFTRYLDRQCLKSHLFPPHVAELALWLCAEESAMCTAQTFVVDGGVV